MQRILRHLTAALALAGTALVSGCAGGFLLENHVQSFSQLGAPPAPASFGFERLPSQQADPVQAQLEAMAAASMSRLGLRRDDASPALRVQVSARVQRTLSPYADPWHGMGFGWGLGGRHFGVFGGLPRMETPWFQREVNLVMRESATNRVVYETQAASSGPWLDNSSVLPVMFDAALQGFPNPPPGVRRVDVHVAPR